jgi:outer membrane beta-barrel protein
MQRFWIKVAWLAIMLNGSVALAAGSENDNPLDGQPAVRHKLLLRDMRFEIGPSFNFTLNRAFRHAFLIGLKAEFHINDYFSVGTDIGFGINFDTGLTGEMEKGGVPPQYPTGQCNNSTNNQCNQLTDFKGYRDRFADIFLLGDVRGTFTPMQGKLAIFSKAFLLYDFYVFAGFGFGMTKNNTNEPSIDAANEGFRPGFAWGAGMHMFVNNWISIGLEVRNVMFNDNETGGDTTRGLTDKEQQAGEILWDGDDQSFNSHFTVGFNFTFYLPTTVEMTR